MAKRGRPRHPDILTPREQEVLALIREAYRLAAATFEEGPRAEPLCFASTLAAASSFR